MAFIKRYGNLMLFALVAFMTVYIIGKELNFNEFMQIFRSADKFYFFLAVLAMFIYGMVEAWMLLVLIRQRYPKETYIQGYTLSMIGQFYNLVTPGASGGQPLELIEMTQTGIKAGYGSAVLVIKTLLYQLAVTIVGIYGVVFNLRLLEHVSGTSKAFVIFGLTINVLGSAIILIVALMPKVAHTIVVWCVKLLAKIRIFKDEEAWLKRAENFIDDYAQGAKNLKENPWQSLMLLVVNILDIFLYFSITYWIYKALDLHAYNAFQVIGFQAVLYLFYTFIPLPGGSGGAEVGFAVIFGPVFGQGKAQVAMVIWRFITFYLVLAFCGTYIAIHSFRNQLQVAKNENSKKEGGIEEGKG